MQYPFKHSVCGKVIFHETIEPKASVTVPLDRIILPDGSHPKAGDPIYCPHCKVQVEPGEARYEISD